MREEVSNELAEVINEFGPQMFEDFNEVSVQLCILGTICLTSCSGASSFPLLPHPLQVANQEFGGGRVPRVALMPRVTYLYIPW